MISLNNTETGITQSIRNQISGIIASIIIISVTRIGIVIGGIIGTNLRLFDALVEEIDDEVDLVLAAIEQIGAVDNKGIGERNAVVWVREIGFGGREEVEITRPIRKGIKGEGLFVVMVIMVVPNEVIF
ncbi:hypothetical protein GOBAR_DD04832 [Gossypium barbadense]|nr:hypothetical protein GOBAR_DD04832 [Gossypium barbadense]